MFDEPEQCRLFPKLKGVNFACLSEPCIFAKTLAPQKWVHALKTAGPDFPEVLVDVRGKMKYLASGKEECDLLGLMPQPSEGRVKRFWVPLSLLGAFPV